VWSLSPTTVEEKDMAMIFYQKELRLIEQSLEAVLVVLTDKQTIEEIQAILAQIAEQREADLHGEYRIDDENDSPIGYDESVFPFRF
jgi:hypothetical protein